jgi:hypothetical protein
MKRGEKQSKPLWEQGVGGSNPLAPTSKINYLSDSIRNSYVLGRGVGKRFPAFTRFLLPKNLPENSFVLCFQFEGFRNRSPSFSG